MGRARGRRYAGICLVGLAVAGIPGRPAAAPARCDLPVTATPSTLPPGSRTARIRFPAGAADVHVHASRGTTGPPVTLVAGSAESEFVASPDSPPTVIVAAVGPGACGFTAIRVAALQEVPAVPEPATLTVVEPGMAIADREAEVLVYVFAVDGRGAPRRGAAPRIVPGVGAIGRVEPLGPGAWRTRWRVPPGESVAASVTASLDTGAASTASLARKPGEPQTIELAPEGAAAPGRPAVVVARIRDSAGNLTDGAIALSAEGAQPGAAERLERGVYRIPVAVPAGSRDTSVVVTAQADRAIATATIPIAPSAAATVKVAPHDPIRADGSAEGRFEVLEVEVTDAYGNPVEDAPVGSGGRGEFRAALPLAPGRWALPYRPPRVTQDTTEEVVVEAGGASTTVALRLRASRVSFSPGVKGGVALPSGAVAPAASLEAGVWRTFGGAQLGLVLEVGWWRVSRSSTAVIGGVPASFDSTQDYVPLLLSLGWRIPFAGGWMGWATAGGGLAVVSSRSQAAGEPAVSETGLAGSASGSLSAGPRLGPGWLFLEARATWIGDPGLSTLSGSSFTFLGFLGYRFDVG